MCFFSSFVLGPVTGILCASVSSSFELIVSLLQWQAAEDWQGSCFGHHPCFLSLPVCTAHLTSFCVHVCVTMSMPLLMITVRVRDVHVCVRACACCADKETVPGMSIGSQLVVLPRFLCLFYKAVRSNEGLHSDSCYSTQTPPPSRPPPTIPETGPTFGSSVTTRMCRKVNECVAKQRVWRNEVVVIHKRDISFFTDYIRYTFFIFVLFEPSLMFTYVNSLSTVSLPPVPCRVCCKRVLFR